MEMYIPTTFFQVLEIKGEKSHQNVIIKELLEIDVIFLYSKIQIIQGI